jgi:hypothetical protein
MRQHGEEPPFDRRARVGKLTSRRGARWLTAMRLPGEIRWSNTLSQNTNCSSRCEPDDCCRFFFCARCWTPTHICRRCDRGQIYCSRDCSSEARRARQREARARYQASPRGRQMHVERSRRYRARQRVTDQGLLPAEKPARQSKGANADAVASRQRATAEIMAVTICSRCGKHFSRFVRLGPIRKQRQRSVRPGTSPPTAHY